MGPLQNLLIMNITNLALIFKQLLCTKNMLNIEFQHTTKQYKARVNDGVIH